MIKSYLPTSVYSEKKGDMFEMILGILASGNIKDKATEGLVVNTLFGSAVLEKHLVMLINWFKTNAIHDLQGNKMESIDITKKHKHEIIKRIWTSKE